MQKTIAIVGGGAGGIFAALGAAKEAAAEESAANSEPIRIVILERNPRIGIKILISGGGKCNITHAGDIETILREGFLRTNEQRFLKRALYRYTNQNVLDLLERQGVYWHARENGRIFPNLGRAEDVLEAFERELATYNIEILTKRRMTGLARSGNQWIVEDGLRSLECDAVILATGGVSYPKVGTTGDGITQAKTLEHQIVPLKSALAPIHLMRVPVDGLHGVALRDVEIAITQFDQVIAKRTGDILMTHRGLSGPAVLDVTRDAAEHFEAGPLKVIVNLLNISDEKARELLLSVQNERPTQQIKTWLEELVPNRFAPFVLQQAGLSIDKKWNALTREERKQLLEAVTRYSFGEIREIPIDRGEVTAGGISLKEVDPKTMMSRKMAGLFFCGEMLDIAGEIGGYNLQAAYSTGWVAGEEAVRYLHTTKQNDQAEVERL
ncbi:MAG: aminoacetone oxidase family FAD-binding enzyme [Candidatus Kapaibacterium sp.]|jgi:predicted Rossmann fold flavoprotein